MKRMILLCCMLFVGLMLVACGKEEKVPMELQVSQMKSICELATMECYYHNVAKYKEEDAEGILLWKKDKHFWIEYSGVVMLGIDASLVQMTVKDDVVSITMPPATVQDCRVDQDSLSEESFIVAKNSAKVTAEDQTKAFQEAQMHMKEAAASDKALLYSAQERAVELLEDYVENIGNQIDKKYQIEWIYVDEQGNKISDGIKQQEETQNNS